MDRTRLLAELEEDAAHVMAPMGLERREEIAACRALMGWWLRALAGVAAMVFERIAAAQREATPSEAHERARMLLERAMRWMRALRRVLGRGAAPASQRLDRLDRIAGAEARKSDQAKARPKDGPRPDAPVVELVSQICADLNEAAWLLGETAAARYVTRIGISATAMLTGGATEELREWHEAATGAEAAPLLAIAGPDAADTG